MRIVKSFLAVMVVISLLLSTTVFSNAAEDRFIAIDVAEYNEYDDQIVKKHAFYTDGKYLYASIDTLDRYTFYDYDEQYSAFVRVGQDYRLSLSKTTLDFENKKATVKMINGEKEYKLHNVIKFGDEYYLPLDQMCAFLMASVDFIDNKLIIKNSGFSIADAAYNYNNYSYVFNYSDIVDGIFAGNEDLYFAYCIVGFYGSSIFGLRIKNLDLISKSGDTEYYQDFLQECITDFDEFLKTQADEDTFEKNVKDAISFTEGLNGVLEIGKNTTTISKTAYGIYQSTKDIDIFQDIEEEDLAKLDIEYIEVDQWDDVFGALSTSVSYMEYFTKVLSMTEDHKLMLRDCNDDATNDNAGFQLKTAIINNFHQFGADSFTTISSKVAETLIEKIPDTALDLVVKKAPEKVMEGVAGTYIKKIVPTIAVIKAVDLAFKLLGYDLSDNSQYSLMLEGLANSYLADRYSVLKNDAGKTKESSEKFRRAAIFSLLASKNAFESGNSLDKKLEGSGTLFNDEIDVVCARLNLFYRASESSCFENIESIDAVIKENQESVSSCDIINTAVTITTQVIAGEKDFEYLEQIMFDCVRDYNSGSADATEDAYSIVFGVLGGMYGNIYSGDAYDMVMGIPDPQNKYYNEFTGYAYYKFPSEKVDWILENILNTKPDHSYVGVAEWMSSVGMIETTLSYYDNGYYYTNYTETGSETQKMQVLDWNVNANGRYEITIGRFQYGEEKPTYKITVTAVLKEIESERVWSIYKIQAQETYSSNICGTWESITDVETDRIVHFLYLGNDGTAEYKYGFYKSELIEIYSGTWSEENGMLLLNISGGAAFLSDDNYPEVYTKEIKCFWQMNDDELILTFNEENQLFSYDDENVLIFRRC